ncbi:MAG: endonuclease VII domain-containing protein, partial [Nitrosopumilaceae archaeon]
LNRYGICENEYKILLELQENKCGICQTENPKGRHKIFHVDHNHNTEMIRGLLCDKCNRGLGFFDDNIKNLNRAVKYLKMYQ